MALPCLSFVLALASTFPVLLLIAQFEDSNLPINRMWHKRAKIDISYLKYTAAFSGIF